MRPTRVAVLAGVVLIVVLAAAQAATAAIVYGANRLGEVVELDLAGNTSRTVGSLLFGTQAMDQDPATGLVYYFEFMNTGDDLATWNPSTGANTLVRHYRPRPNLYAKRMAFSPAGVLYMMDAKDKLYRIDKVNGNLTALGATSGLFRGSLGGTGDMAFAPNGTLYVVTYQHLYSLNVTTRRATLLYPNLITAGPGIHVFGGLAYCDGMLFANDLDEATGGSNMWRIDPRIGVITPLGPTASWMNDLTSCPAA
jgi:hypothetical protein